MSTTAQTLPEIRCVTCGKLIAKGKIKGHIVGRCGHINEIKEVKTKSNEKQREGIKP